MAMRILVVFINIYGLYDFAGISELLRNAHFASYTHLQWQDERRIAKALSLRDFMKSQKWRPIFIIARGYVLVAIYIV